MANVIFKVGTKDQYNALQPKDTNTLYWLSDTKELYKGEDLYGIGANASAKVAGLMSTDDKQKLDDLVKGSTHNLTAADKSITISDSDDSKQIKVAVSTKEHNALKLEASEDNSGLFVDSVAYALEKVGEAEGFAAQYKLKKTVNGVDSYDSVTIDIPKDLVVKSGTVGRATDTNVPYDGAAKDDPYIELTIANNEGSKIYIPVKDLIDKNAYVLESIQGDKGTAIIKNDKTGGGVWFKGSDSIEGFVGVNDGTVSNGKPTPHAQMYCADSDTKKNGSFLSVYQDKITYTSQAHANAGGKLSEEDSELAVKRDLKGFVPVEITGAKGKAQVFNESDGGGIKFVYNDDESGKHFSRISVHDGSAVGDITGLMAQIQGGTVDDTNHNKGTTISVFEDKATYRSKTNESKKINDTKLEIATVGDLDAYVLTKINGDNGTGMIFNEKDGGGAKFVHSDKSEAYVGVSDGGKSGLMAQIYADVNEGQDGPAKWVGSRINVYNKGIYYVSMAKQKAGKQHDDVDCEIATKGDVKDIVASAIQWEEM